MKRVYKCWNSLKRTSRISNLKSFKIIEGKITWNMDGSSNFMAAKELHIINSCCVRRKCASGRGKNSTYRVVSTWNALDDLSSCSFHNFLQEAICFWVIPHQIKWRLWSTISDLAEIWHSDRVQPRTRISKIFFPSYRSYVHDEITKLWPFF